MTFFLQVVEGSRISLLSSAIRTPTAAESERAAQDKQQAMLIRAAVQKERLQKNTAARDFIQVDLYI